MSGTERPRDETPIDPLVWHYERERRLGMRGSVQWEHKILSRAEDIHLSVRVNIQLVSNSKYLDVLVPTNVSREQFGPAIEFLLNNANDLAKKGPLSSQLAGIKEKASMSFEGFPESELTSDDCQFTGRIFLYTHYFVQPESKATVAAWFKEKGLSLVIRDEAWIEKVKKFIDRPTVFLSHDSKDKDDLVRELASELNGPEIKVWYDEFSLKPGVRLRKSLDEGLEEADYFVPIITQNFISNAKYAQYEIDSIIQKYIVEKKPVIIPVCVGVDPSRLKEISRLLSDTVAIVHRSEHTIKNLASQIAVAISPRIPKVGEPLPEIQKEKNGGLFSVGITIGPVTDGTGAAEDKSGGGA